MINAVHSILFARDAEAVRGFLADALELESDEGWGVLASIEVPGLGPLGLYEPRHPVPQRR